MRNNNTANTNTWDVESDSYDVEELSDAELAEAQGGFFDNITQISQQYANFNVGSTVVQISIQSAS